MVEVECPIPIAALFLDPAQVVGQGCTCTVGALLQQPGEASGLRCIESTCAQVSSTTFLDAIEIMPEFRGRGIGTVIIRDVVARARREGKAVRLEAFKVNGRAIRLYERLGFREYGATATHKLLSTR